MFPDLAGYLRQPFWFHFPTREQAHSFPPFHKDRQPPFQSTLSVVGPCMPDRWNRYGTHALGSGQPNSQVNASWRGCNLGDDLTAGSVRILTQCPV